VTRRATKPQALQSLPAKAGLPLEAFGPFRGPLDCDEFGQRGNLILRFFFISLDNE
jgi:hypothetical protein